MGASQSEERRMWMLLLCALADTTGELRVSVAPAESLSVTVAGQGTPVLLIPGLFGSAFAYRTLVPQLTAAGHQAIVIEPLGIGGSPPPARAPHSPPAPGGPRARPAPFPAGAGAGPRGARGGGGRAPPPGPPP